MKYMRRAAGYSRTDKTNTETAKELNITPALDKIQDYKRKWIQHVNQIAQTDKKPRTKRQKEPRKTTEESSGCVRPAQLLDTYMKMI
jgi:hypothetical protein